MIKQIINFIFIDQKTERISHTKTFSNIGYALFCFGFIWHTYSNTPIDVNLWTVFGVVVIGNRTLAKGLAIHKDQLQK